MTKIIVLFMAALCSCGALGLELLAPKRLTDDGFGSDANAAADHPLADDLAFVFGSKNTANGRVVPVVWQVSNGYLSDIIEEIPIPSIAQGEAIGGAVSANGDLAVVGNLRAGTIQQAVVWRKPWMGGWSQPEPLAPGSDGSLAARADYCGDGFVFAAGDVQINGRRVAAAFRVDIQGVDEAVALLPTPAAGSSSGREILVDCTSFGSLLVAGSITDGNGNTHPAIWRHTANGWATFPNSVRRTEGTANSLVVLDQDGETEIARLDVCGTLLRGGRTTGFAARGKYGTAEAGYTLLPPLDGYENSAAVSHYDGGDTGTHEIGHWMGISSNRGGLPVATLWFYDWLESQPPTSVAAQQLLFDPSSVSQMVGIEESGVEKIYVGQCMDEEDFPIPSAFLFAPAGWTLPEVGDVVLAASGSETHREPDGEGVTMALSAQDGGLGEFIGDLVALWHDDGRAWRIGTAPRGDERAAIVDLVYNVSAALATGGAEFRKCMFPMCGGFMVTASALSNSGEGAGTLNVYVLNPQSGAYSLRGAFGLGETAQTIEALTWDCLDHDQCVVAPNGQIRVRLEYVQAGSGGGALSIDSARLH